MIAKKSNATSIAVIGGGSWATALVKILSEGDVKIKWWLRNQEFVDHIKDFQHNPKYLSDVQINLKKVKPDSNIQKVMAGVDYVILAVPAAFIKETLAQLKPEHFRGVSVISAIKGIVPGNNELITDYVERVFYVHQDDIMIIGGPCHSEEVALEKQSYLTVAGHDYNNAMRFAQLLNCRYIKTHTVKDLYGVEYCAILKNIIAIASGITHGLNHGDNFQAVLVSNAMQEIKRFLDIVDPIHRDLNDSAYLGDLLVTSYSQFSRNRTFGNMIGHGYSVKSAQLEMNMIAEGYYAVKCMKEIKKKYDVEMPICDFVYNIVYDKINPAVEIQILQSILR